MARRNFIRRANNTAASGLSLTHFNQCQVPCTLFILYTFDTYHTLYLIRLILIIQVTLWSTITLPHSLQPICQVPCTLFIIQQDIFKIFFILHTFDTCSYFFILNPHLSLSSENLLYWGTYIKQREAERQGLSYPPLEFVRTVCWGLQKNGNLAPSANETLYWHNSRQTICKKENLKREKRKTEKQKSGTLSWHNARLWTFARRKTLKETRLYRFDYKLYFL